MLLDAPPPQPQSYEDALRNLTGNPAGPRPDIEPAIPEDSIPLLPPPPPPPRSRRLKLLP